LAGIETHPVTGTVDPQRCRQAGRPSGQISVSAGSWAPLAGQLDPLDQFTGP
jgi:hypothetical protein